MKKIKRVNLAEVMSDVAMAIITDDYNEYVYAVDNMPISRGNGVMNTVLRMNVQATRDEMQVVADKIVELMTELNAAFNRAVGAPESMKLFKVIARNVRYAGNDTVAVELELATLASGNRSAIELLLAGESITFNLWGTKACVFDIENRISGETYGLGNAMRSWNAIAKRFGYECNEVQYMPALLINYVQ